MRAHEIIDTFQEHKVSSYFQRELNITGRNPEAVYDILFKGTDFSKFTRDTLDFYEDVLSGFWCHMLMDLGRRVREMTLRRRFEFLKLM